MKTYNRIAERLMTEFTQEMRESLRAEIDELRARFNR